MKNKFRDAYLKYLKYSSKYVVGFVSEQPDKVINIETLPETFPHLVGKDLLTGWSKRSPKEFIDKILIGAVSDQNIWALRKKDKFSAAIVLGKLRALQSLTDLENVYMTKEPVKIIDKSPKKYYVLYKEIRKNNFTVLALTRDKIGIYHPSSLMGLNGKKRKMERLLTCPKVKINNFVLSSCRYKVKKQ